MPAFRPLHLRIALVLLAAVAIVGTPGCRWFHKKNPYAKTVDSRPLEVPPELDAKDVEAATATTSGSVTRSSISGGASSTATRGLGFTMSGDRAAVFDRVGAALATVSGVTIASRAQVLGAYDVDYQGSKFLVRISESGTGSFVSAVDPRGQAAQGEAPTKLIATLKSALGGN